MGWLCEWKIIGGAMVIFDVTLSAIELNGFSAISGGDKNGFP